MSKKIKSFVVGLVTLLGLFINLGGSNSNVVSAATSSCYLEETLQRSVTIYDLLPTEFWFEFGTVNPPLQYPTQTSVRYGYQKIIPPPNADPNGYTVDIFYTATNLNPTTTYYYRGVASNSAGTGRGAVINFTTLPCSTNTAPAITLLGSNPMSVNFGTTFTDPGATAWDNEDGNITSSIVKTGSVNTSVAGTYTLFYNVKDSKGLSAPQVTRTVTVNPATPTQYTVTALAGSGIASATPYQQSVVSGNKAVVTVNSLSGYSAPTVSSSSTCPMGSFSGNTYTTGAITSSNCSVTFNATVVPQGPTVDLTADDYSVDYGFGTTLRWTSTNMPAGSNCTTSGGSNGWAGVKSANGNFPTGNLTSTQTYSISCNNGYGSATDSVTVTVGSQPQGPTVDIKANGKDAESVSYGGSANLTWTSTNMPAGSNCTASGPSNWVGSGIKSPSGSFATGNLTSTQTYSISCNNGYGSATDSVTVTVAGQVLNPTVTLTANPTSITSGGSSKLTWTTTNANSCTGTNFNTNGYTSNMTGVYVYPTTTTTYTITCYGATGTTPATDSKTVTVTQVIPNDPTVTLTANPMSVDSGKKSTLSWSSTNAQSCYASGAWSGAKALSGSQSTGKLTSAKTYTITCYSGSNATGSQASASVTVTINTPPKGNIDLIPLSMDFLPEGEINEGDDVTIAFKVQNIGTQTAGYFSIIITSRDANGDLAQRCTWQIQSLAPGEIFSRGYADDYGSTCSGGYFTDDITHNMGVPYGILDAMMPGYTVTFEVNDGIDGNGNIIPKVIESNMSNNTLVKYLSVSGSSSTAYEAGNSTYYSAPSYQTTSTPTNNANSWGGSSSSWNTPTYKYTQPTWRNNTNSWGNYNNGSSFNPWN